MVPPVPLEAMRSHNGWTRVVPCAHHCGGTQRTMQLLSTRSEWSELHRDDGCSEACVSIIFEWLPGVPTLAFVFPSFRWYAFCVFMCELLDVRAPSISVVAVFAMLSSGVAQLAEAPVLSLSLSSIKSFPVCACYVSRSPSLPFRTCTKLSLPFFFFYSFTFPS